MPALNTLKDVRSALAALNLHPSTEVLKSISDSCRDVFLGKLHKAVDGDASGQNIEHVAALLQAFSPETRQALASAHFASSPEKIAQAASAPMKFLSAVAAIGKPEHPKHKEARAWLEGIFPRPSEPEARPAQGKATTPAAPVHLQTSQTGQDKEYASCHVYGSTYALCFNAGSWNGEPGIMVDAAVSSAPKSYEWGKAAHLWLDSGEVAGILAVLRRYQPEIEFSAHGSRNEKSFSLTRQKDGYYAKVTCRNAPEHPIRGARIMTRQVMEVSLLFLKVLLAAYPGFPPEEIIASVRNAYAA
jgi:hypothetical protein